MFQMQRGEQAQAGTVRAFAAAFDEWLRDQPAALVAARTPSTDYAGRVEQMTALMHALHEHGWARHGWPEAFGGLGGSILHRAAMWDLLARHGVPGMALFEHLEVLAPTLVALGPPPLLQELLPRFLDGSQLWAQGFSEPGAGSDLADLRTRGDAVDGGFRVTGRKVWTSWARYARWCLVLVRTGSIEERHRGLTALVVDLHDPLVEVTPITQANGTDELAEVAFDGVVVPDTHVVGRVGDGWKVAMHILSHERGTYAWFRHCFLNALVAQRAGHASPSTDQRLGDALLDLVAVSCASSRALRDHEAGDALGPNAAFTKVLLCEAEQHTYDWVRADDPVAIALLDGAPEHATLRQEYLFSRIVTIYGGSQQMQLETIAKHILRLP